MFHFFALQMTFPWPHSYPFDHGFQQKHTRAFQQKLVGLYCGLEFNDKTFFIM